MPFVGTCAFRFSVLFIKSKWQVHTGVAQGLKAVRAQSGADMADRLSSIRTYVDRTISEYPAVEWYTS